jgi:ABC-2 type transport system permease protein
VIASHALTAMLLSLAIAATLIAFGRLVYGVGLPAARLPAVALVVLVGSASFSCIGFALVTFVKSEDSVLPVVLGVGLPLYFISGIFIEFLGIPPLLRSIATVFPVRHLAAALTVQFASGGHGRAFSAGDIAIVAAWGLGAIVMALLRFRWEPQGT